MSRGTLRWCVLCLGAASLGYGLYRGEATVVLAKALRVCLECIGLG